MNKLLDLRFVIGVFFVIVGLLLLLHYFFAVRDPAVSTIVNRNTGIVFLIFGAFMIIISRRNKLEG